MKAEEYGNLLTSAEVKELLERELADREELTYDQKLTVSHIDRVKKISLKNVKKILEELEKLERVSDYLAHKLVDVIPKDYEDIDMVYQRERFRLSDEEKDQILALFEQHM